MRITTGILKGRKLISPKIKDIHLTEEKVRKAIFDVLGDSVKNKSFLELFAGSGALGMEAISRGAERVVFVDRDKKCIEVIKKNIPEEIKAKTRVIQADVLKAIDYLSRQKESFDFIILDPPYKKGWVVLSLKKISENTILLKPKARIIVEHHCEEDLELREIKNLFLFKQKRYGKTVVSFLKFIKNEKNRCISRDF